MHAKSRAEEKSADCREILFRAFGIGLHGLFARSPVSGADLVRVGLHVLEGLQNPQGFINVTTHGQVVDRGVHDDAIGIDDEQATQGDTLSVIEDVVSRRNFLLQVSDEGIVDVTQATLIACCLNPSQVAELAVYGNAEYFGVLAGEIGITVTEGRDFSRADEGEIQRVEEQHHVLAPVLGQRDFLELLVHHSGSCEIRGLLANTQATVVGHDWRENE